MATEFWAHLHLRLAHHITVDGGYLGRVHFTRYDIYKQNPEHAGSALPHFTVIFVFYNCVINYHTHSYANKMNLTQVCVGWVFCSVAHQTEIKVSACSCNSHLKLGVLFQIHWQISVPCSSRADIFGQGPISAPRGLSLFLAMWPLGRSHIATGFLPDQQKRCFILF